MGLFDSENLWIHPERTEPTYELIYNLKSDIYLEEDGVFHTIKKGEAIVLRPGIPHRGFKESNSPVSFYWIHFTPENENIDFPFFSESFSSPHLFRELMHYSLMPDGSPALKNAVLMHILTLMAYENSNNSVPDVARKAFAYIGANATIDLTAAKVSEHFSYSSEHLSRIMKKFYGVTLKTLIDSAIINSAKGLISNTNMSVKEISAHLKFPNSNAFINFFKYHENISPAAFRKQFTYVCINSK